MALRALGIPSCKSIGFPLPRMLLLDLLLGPLGTLQKMQSPPPGPGALRDGYYKDPYLLSLNLRKSILDFGNPLIRSDKACDVGGIADHE